MISAYANPHRFFTLATKLLPWLMAAAVVAAIIGLYAALISSPPDYQQGITVRIMYVHVPAAWLALMIYSSMAVAAVCSLVWGHVLADIYSRAAAPLGAAMTALCLLTGMLWGKPMWGAYWVWDARLTSVLILLLLYLGYMALVQSLKNPMQADKAGNILLLVGVVNIPIIRFSVDWWATLHQPASVLRAGGPAVHEDMLRPLLLMALAYLLGFVVLVLLRMRAEFAARRALLQKFSLVGKA